MSEGPSLRRSVIRGGVYLTVRQGLGLALHIGGVILLTRAIGPGPYGLYAAALAITTYLSELGQWGVGVYLVRRPGELDRSTLRQATGLVLLLGVAALLVGQALVPWLTEWTAIDGLGTVARVMILGLPVLMLSTVPLASLERALDYRRVAWLELGGLCLYYAVALSLAYAGYGAWAPVLGWWAQQATLFAAMHIAAGHAPVPGWSGRLARDMVSYGLSFSASMWIWQLRNLVNPVVVGRVLGAEAVGVVALTHQLVRHLGFVLVATWRLSTAALARVQDDTRKLIGAMSEGMQLQTLAVGPPLVGFAVLAPAVIPVLLGEEWAGMAAIFPFVAFGYLTNAVFNLHSSALYVRRWNWDVARFHALHIVLFAGAAAVLTPRLGLIGYGTAELVAIPSYIAIHAAVRRRFGSPAYGGAARWWLAFGIALSAPYAGWWVVAAPLIVALLPSSRRMIGAQLRVLRGAAGG